MEAWSKAFGKAYTDRNALSPGELDRLYNKNFGITRTDLNKEFLGNLSQGIKILEVGSNVGNQLLCLQKMGFKNLYGIEINSYAVKCAKKRLKEINIIQGSVLDIPFKDSYFDLVFTSGVLIHIAPHDINLAMREMRRCAKKYIWGLEYYADKYSEILYRGYRGLLWKANFAKLYLDLFDDLKLIKSRKLKYLDDSGNIDEMFLFKK